MDWLQRFEAGDRRALSRLMTLAERGDEAFPALFDAVCSKAGTALRVGVTGPPGAGKSTLVNAMIRALREQDSDVGVVAVDPTSPFTGGALLGDRVRMGEHTLDDRVFIRSMATRGSLGGLARASIEVADLLDAFGFEHVLVETVGVGQIEHDVVAACDLVVVVLHPGAGDSVQALKAGLLELADVFVLNKADHDGVDRLAADIGEMLELRVHRHGERLRVVRTVAHRAEGVGELLEAVTARWTELDTSGERDQRRRRRRRSQLERIVEERVAQQLWADGAGARTLEAFVADRTLPLYATAAALLREMGENR